jgi:hypothetical protein
MDKENISVDIPWSINSAEILDTVQVSAERGLKKKEISKRRKKLVKIVSGKSKRRAAWQ